MKSDKRIIMSVIWIIIGIALIGLSFAKVVDDFWGSMGSALLMIGVLQMLKFHRLSKNKEYREKMEIEMADERNHFIRNKAWAWTGYLFILIAGIAVIVFKIIGQDLLSMAASVAVCFMLVLYWASYWVLNKKY